jgi:RND superfamily putative drug exporter
VVVARPPAKHPAAAGAAPDRLHRRFEEATDLPIVGVWGHRSKVVGEKLTSRAGPHGQATLVVLQLSNEFLATDNIRVLKRVLATIDEAGSETPLPLGLHVGITGSAAIGGDTLASAAESIRNTELATVVLVVVILLAVYRAPLLVLVPLASIGAALAVATDLVAWLTQADAALGAGLDFRVFKTTRIFIVVVLFGGGTDYCLFLIARYREELERGVGHASALTAALGHSGTALSASALTTIVGLGMMVFADFGKFRNSGPAIALCLAVMLAAALTLAPALLAAGGRWIFWPFVGPARQREAGRQGTVPSYWTWLADRIVGRPALAFTLAAAVMVPLAYRGLTVQVGYDLPNELDPSRPSVRGTAMLQRHFGPGDLGPVTILIRHAPGAFDQPSGRKRIARLARDLAGLEGVGRVRSIVEPLGDHGGPKSLLTVGGLKRAIARNHPTTKATFLTQVPALVGTVTRLDVILRHDPFSAQSMAIVDAIDKRLAALASNPGSYWHRAEFELLGTTAGIRDLKALAESDQARICLLVVLAVLGILLLVLRRPAVSLFLVLTVVLSYLATIGLSELVFSVLYGDTYRGLDWKLPLFLFVLLVALGIDYNIYLITRVFEEQRRHGPLEGLRRGLVSTGGIITSCGLITAGSFVAMMAGTLRAIVELGFALSVGVLIDTFLVRPLLVPSLLAWVYRLQGAADETPPRGQVVEWQAPAPPPRSKAA